jgi:hypothetical protein
MIYNTETKLCSTGLRLDKKKSGKDVLTEELDDSIRSRPKEVIISFGSFMWVGTTLLKL